jgi:hypothetical protein
MKFIEINCKIYDRKQVDLLGINEEDAELSDCLCTIRVDSIIAVRQRIEDDEEEIHKNSCVIYLSSEKSFICYNYSYNQIKDILNNKNNEKI